MSNNAEEFRIRFGVDAESMKSGMSQAVYQGSKTIQEGFKDIGGDILKGFTAGAILAKLEGVFSKVKELQAGASKTGINIEDFQKLSTVANDELPEGAAKFETALTKLNVKIGEGATELEKWGIHATTAEAAMYEIADKMKATADPAERAAMAVDLMGKSGADMVPLLERGAEALRSMAASKPGWSKEDIEDLTEARKSIEETNNQLTIWIGKSYANTARFFKALGRLSTGDLGQNNMDPAARIKAIQAETQHYLDILNGKTGGGSSGTTSFAKETKEQTELEKINQDRLSKMQSSQAKIRDLMEDILRTREEIDNLDKSAPDYYEKRDALLLKIAKNEEEIGKVKEKQTREDERQNKLLAEKTKELQSTQQRLAKNQHDMAEVDRVTPTIEMLAGRRYTKNLNQQYGEGGRFDLSRGNGPFSDAARGYELAQKQQMWDLIHGNAEFKDKNDPTKLTGGAAFEDQQRAIGFHNQLAGAGLETPEMLNSDMAKGIEKTANEITELKTTIKQLVKNGALNTSITASD